MAYTFLGHASAGGTLMYKGKAYRVGDSVPMTKMEMQHHAKAGLQFEGIEDVPQTGAPLEPTADDTPKDDRGAPLEAKGKR